MVTELITSDSGKTKSSPKSLKGAMKVIKKLKGRIGLGEFSIFPIWTFPVEIFHVENIKNLCGFRAGRGPAKVISFFECT
jgi:hypothetical protein